MKKSPEKQEKNRASENSQETAQKDETKNETVSSSSSETSPNASSSGLQATVGKRRRTVTGIKTAYSFFCDEVLGCWLILSSCIKKRIDTKFIFFSDQVSPEVCQLYGEKKITRQTRNVMQAK